MNRPQCSTAECDSPPAQGVWWAFVWHIAELQKKQRFVDVGAPSIAPADFVRSTRPQTAGEAAIR